MELATLENWLWEAACAIRGPVEAPKFKDYILPLVFLKRLSDVFDDEMARLAQEYGSRKAAEQLVEGEREHGTIAKGSGIVRFYIPPNARWDAIRRHARAGLGQFLTDAVRSVAKENPRLHGVIDVVDFNATAAGQRIIADEYLYKLVEVLSKHRLGLNDAEPDILGCAYEYLLRKFAEGQGQSVGEFYTPREVAILMARLLEPEPGMTVYDPACGSGGLLVKCHLRLLETHGVLENGRRVLPSQYAPLRLYGQEINPTTFAIARMNAVIHDMEADIRLGDTMRQPAFKDHAGRLQTFDLVVANPMWNQKFPTGLYENDPYDRFRYGAPPSSSADWGWLQHMLASLKEGGRMAVVLDTGAVSRGSGNQGSNRERDIRKAFVEKDLIEAVILLPENLFYNTTAPGIILIINRRANIFVLIDEAHRTTGGDLGNYLMGALPSATFIGFTGTPIDKTQYGKGTFKVFGGNDSDGYLDKYSIRESIQDGATVPLHYQMAPNDLIVDREAMEREFWAAAEREETYEILSPDAFLRPYLDDYQRLVEMYRLLRGAYEPHIPVEKSFLRKTAEIVQQHTSTQKVQEAGATYHIGVEALLALVKESKSDTVKVFNLLRELHRLVEAEGRRQAHLIPIGERAEALRRAFEERQFESQQALAELESLVCSLKEAQKQRRQSQLSSEAFAVGWWARLQKGLEPKKAEQLARAVEPLLQRYPYWATSVQQERELRQALYKALMGCGVQKEVVEWVEGILELLRKALA